jgi:hypothetical protein
MPRFFLLDGSLRDSRGHHDSYARRLLQAAQRFGYENVLAPNRSYRGAPVPETWQMLPTFDSAIYDDPLLMPDWGSPPRDDCRWPGMRDIAERWQDARWARRRRAIAGNYARNLTELFSKLRPAPGDQIFLAAASELSLVGAARAIAANPALAAVDWHAMFHFNNLLGRPAEYRWQRRRTARLHRALSSVVGVLGRDHFHPYATTAELAAELTQLNLAVVRDVGYPIDEPLRTCGRQQRAAGPLRITFAGDARIEKGFQHLPAIVDAVFSHQSFSDPSLAARVQFVVQGSFPFKLPCRSRNLPIVDARSALEKHGPDRVRVITEPQSDDEYRQTILNTDIGLLPYDSRHYYARCSGVLVEMFSAGIPCIVPGDCWMASQVAHSGMPDAPAGIVAASHVDMPQAIATMVRDYDRYRAAAILNAMRWTRWHHPTRIVAEMLSRATSLGGTTPGNDRKIA